MENITLIKVKGDACPRRPPVAPTRPRRSPEDPSIAVKFASAGVAACIADLMTFPLDTAKVRLQIQGEGSSAITGSNRPQSAGFQSSPYRGLVGTIVAISRSEGPRALYNGLAAGLQRQLCFASVRIGLYDSVKQLYTDVAKDHGMSGEGVGILLMAGCTTGTLAVGCAQPTDVVKVRFQAQRAGAVKRYPSVMSAYKIIGKEEGVRGLWKGMIPNITRNCVINCCELVTYDVIKTRLIKSRVLSDNMPCHFVSASGAGLVATVIGSPVDVVKTRFMNSPQGSYSGVLDCGAKMMREEGLAAFYKGFTPSLVRLVSWNIAMFMCYEQLKKAFHNMNNSSNIDLPSVSIASSHERYM